MRTAKWHLAHVILTIIFIDYVSSLRCLDGSDCAPNCSFCDGGACLRLHRKRSGKDQPSTALTCLPHDSLVHTYYPDGCRSTTVLGETMCICSHGDYCNSSTLESSHSFQIIIITAAFYVINVLIV